MAREDSESIYEARRALLRRWIDELCGGQQKTFADRTGQARGACPGWQIDHITPLCSGGADRPVNMQWLTVEQHKAKTREDVRICRTEPAARNFP